jgi:hypothetical protein
MILAPEVASASDVADEDTIAEIVQDALEVTGEELDKCKAIAMEASKYAVTNRERTRNEQHEMFPHFVALLIRLQRYHHDRPFFLGCEFAAAQLNTNKTYVTNWWHCLMKAGFLKRQVEGDRFRLREDGKPGCASEWVWLGWPSARESAKQETKIVVVAPRPDEIARDVMPVIEEQAKGDMESKYAAMTALNVALSRLEPEGPMRDARLAEAEYTASRQEEYRNARLGRNTIYAQDRRHNNPGLVQESGVGRMTAQSSEDVPVQEVNVAKTKLDRRDTFALPRGSGFDAATLRHRLRACEHHGVPRHSTSGSYGCDALRSTSDPRSTARGSPRGEHGRRCGLVAQFAPTG